MSDDPDQNRKRKRNQNWPGIHPDWFDADDAASDEPGSETPAPPFDKTATSWFDDVPMEPPPPPAPPDAQREPDDDSRERSARPGTEDQMGTLKKPDSGGQGRAVNEDAVDGTAADVTAAEKSRPSTPQSTVEDEPVPSDPGQATSRSGSTAESDDSPRREGSPGRSGGNRTPPERTPSKWRGPGRTVNGSKKTVEGDRSTGTGKEHDTRGTETNDANSPGLFGRLLMAVRSLLRSG